MTSLVEIGPEVPEKISKFRQCILLFRNYLPLENGVALHLNKLEFPLPKDAFCQVCYMLKIGPVNLQEEIFKFHQYIFAIYLLSLLAKGRGPSFQI